MAHEATVSKVGEDQLFYLMSRGLAEDEDGESRSPRSSRWSTPSS
jgi:hypothetical protein